MPCQPLLGLQHEVTVSRLQTRAKGPLQPGTGSPRRTQDPRDCEKASSSDEIALVSKALHADRLQGREVWGEVCWHALRKGFEQCDTARSVFRRWSLRTFIQERQKILPSVFG